MDLQPFLEEHPYVDFMNPIVSEKARQLFAQAKNDVEKARIAYLYVWDEIPHSFDIQAQTITARASDVLRYQTDICHAKANLLATLLRSQHIPVGFCFQHLTLAEDDTLGYCVHGYNAIYLEHHWIKVMPAETPTGKMHSFHWVNHNWPSRTGKSTMSISGRESMQNRIWLLWKCWTPPLACKT